MAKILLFLLAICILALIAFALRKKLGKKTKPFFVLLLVCFTLFAVLFEYDNIKISEKKDTLIIAFNQGKTLICKDIEVKNSNFNYEFGTSSLISKDNNQSLKSLIFSIKDCSLKDE